MLFFWQLFRLPMAPGFRPFSYQPGVMAKQLRFSLGACPRIRMCRAHGACEASSRREEEAMSMYIVDDEQRRDHPQHPCALRVAAVGRHLRRWRSSTMCTDIACVAPPCICLPTAATRHILILGQAPSLIKRIYQLYIGQLSMVI